jgi:hypothetical protein
VQDTRYSLGSLWAGIRAELRGVRADRAGRRALRRDLAFAAPRDIIELEAIIERYPEDETADIRQVLRERRLDRELSCAGASVPGRGIS